ncbi:uncharacterized protein Dmoj_GI14104 [Drosophila mojavensis]|uniref:c-SKI SMAD4-binding domain-containing protein n=1 Tax=Drosophila mojavensis TaxID=7230 RepID=B4L7D5_DROMO|nr:uncharacterized protein Dmoj_GI14104 [Drosophila mojavensis]
MAFPESIQKSTRSSTPANGMESSQIAVSPKSNHVSSVMLYGIPIVSLYIEGQERLCLAQISNTLLKQFSYNEIHNRRVALGITCVQCTPVQLEILRRAGAMPVSSRRCGMITRREAERLCKSFLGDNTPPRLPDDFAFSVQHKCAWGCRGSFLPARYNSSRAKCIKCSYCGMFFSPNKFIFHSHRITTNDRYVQPDAANFNSWRRHMTLTGHSHDEKIIHAWEDVKAMFNGGTRKRLVSCNNNNNNNSNNNNNNNNSTSNNNSSRSNSGNTNCNPNQNSPALDQTPIHNSSSISRETKTTLEETLCTTTTMSKRPMNQQYNYSTVAAAAAAAVVGVGVGVTAVAGFNLHRSTVLSPLQSLRNEHDLSIQQQQQQQSQSLKKLNSNDAINESCPWIRTDLSNLQQPLNEIKNEPRTSANYRKVHDEPTDFNIPSILSCSAFKPVVASTAIMSTSLYAARSNDSINNVYISPTQTTTVFTHNSITTESLPTGAIINSTSAAQVEQLNENNVNRQMRAVEPVCTRNTDEDDDNDDDNDPDKYHDSHSGHVADDDDEVVDIETTEDDALLVNESINICPDDISSLSTTQSQAHSLSHSESASPNDDVDVDGITTDVEDEIDYKSNSCSNFHLHNHEIYKLTSMSRNADIKKNVENSSGFNGLKRLSRRKYSMSQQRQFFKKNLSKIDNDKIFCGQSSLHNVPQRVTFPVFFRSHLSSFRNRQSQNQHQRPPSPFNTHRTLYCCDSTARSIENGIE